LQFDRIVCRLRGYSGSLILTPADVQEYLDFAGNEVGRAAKLWGVTPKALISLLEQDIKSIDYEDLLADATFFTIYSKLGYEYHTVRGQCENLSAHLREKEINVNAIRQLLRKVLHDIEIVYLPTYRRIELSIPAPTSRGEKRKTVLSKLGVAQSGLYTADIQFGLGDISDRLKKMYQDMLQISNQGYGKVSANVINDLISDRYRQSGQTANELPRRKELDVFFSRIQDASRGLNRGPYGYYVPPNLDQVYSGDVPADAAPFLNYFLNQLNSVVLETKGLEDLVDNFIDSCNKYLSGEEDLSGEPTFLSENIEDRKRLDFNRQNFEVTVKSSVTDDDIPLEALSSGEKQMVSLFARLYLYSGPKIVLIDEPELSLSLGWQRQILPDVLRAPSCLQVVAITHSPFIFDNELEPYAGSLRLDLTDKPRNEGPLNLLFGPGLPEDPNE
jgi:hypothetical protein